DRSVTLGVNQGGDIVFSNLDPSKAYDQARTAAVKDAIQRAGTLASAANGKLGKILSITEQPEMGGPRPMAKFEAAMRSDSVPVATGENSYRVTVTVDFRLRNED